MNKWPESLDFYRDKLHHNQPHTVNYNGLNYTFQFHGPDIGKTGNWLEVTREDGIKKKFGAGHNSELVWRAFHHVDKGWETSQIPAYKEKPLL